MRVTNDTGRFLSLEESTERPGKLDPLIPESVPVPGALVKAPAVPVLLRWLCQCCSELGRNDEVRGQGSFALVP